jgi:hypothetical protein
MTLQNYPISRWFALALGILCCGGCYASRDIRLRIIATGNREPIAHAEAEIDYPYDRVIWFVPRPPRSRAVSRDDGLVTIRLADFHPARLRIDHAGYQPAALDQFDLKKDLMEAAHSEEGLVIELEPASAERVESTRPQL